MVTTPMKVSATDQDYIGFKYNNPSGLSVAKYQFHLYVIPIEKFQTIKDSADIHAAAMPLSEVAYCMNMDMGEPYALTQQAYDYKADNKEKIFWYQILPQTNVEAFKRSLSLNKEPGLDIDKARKGLAYIFKYGYPNGNSIVLGADLSDVEFRAVTQWAVYYYTGSAKEVIPLDFTPNQRTVAEAFKNKPKDMDLAEASAIFDDLRIYRPVNSTGIELTDHSNTNPQYLLSMKRGTPTPSTPAPSTPTPSTPAPSTPAPSAPAPSTPAPSAPAPEQPSGDIAGAGIAPQPVAPQNPTLTDDGDILGAGHSPKTGESDFRILYFLLPLILISAFIPFLKKRIR